MTFAPTTVCRSCGAAGLVPIFDLGEQPLANAYRVPHDESPEPRYPLALVLCRHCTLVQLAGIVDPHNLFDDYPYFSSCSSTMVEAMGELSRHLTIQRHLRPESLVVDIGSNDGYLLRHYRDLGVRVLGIDPARNVAAAAVEAGIPSLIAYFGARAAEQAVATVGRADVVHANNVMAHVPNINDFTAGLARLLADDGVAIVESPSLVDLVASYEFDTIYHEHVFYYSATAMDALLRRHGLTIVDVEHLSVHGGSLRYTIRHCLATDASSVRDQFEREHAAAVADPATYAALDHDVRRIRRQTLTLLHDLKSAAASIAAYGAAAKGTVLLNHFGIGPDLVEAVVDRNPHKQGRLMPGVGVPIVDRSYLDTRRPTYVLLLAWNLLDEVRRQEAAYLRDGGSLVVLLPEPRVVGP